MAGEPWIYVQIPAYRDAELGRTLLDLYAKAERPERLRTVVVWQRGPDETLPAAVRHLPSLELLDVPYERSGGCNWARAILQSRWDGEPYTLALDSHHRFARGWDATVLAMHASLTARGVPKPLLTAYLPAYDPAREPGARRKRPYKIYPSEREQGILTRLTSYPIPYWRALDGPVGASFLSLHFVFAQGAFNAEVPFDPDIYFFGDEVLTGLRAFLAGYDLYHPHRVVGWHCYDRATRVPHWDDHADWHDRHQRALARLREVFTQTLDSPPGCRTVADYERQAMVELVAA